MLPKKQKVLDQHCFLKKPNCSKYAQDLVVKWAKPHSTMGYLLGQFSMVLVQPNGRAVAQALLQYCYRVQWCNAVLSVLLSKHYLRFRMQDLFIELTMCKALLNEYICSVSQFSVLSTLLSKKGSASYSPG